MKSFKEHVTTLSKEDKAAEIERIRKILYDHYGYDELFVLHTNGSISLSKDLNIISNEIFDTKMHLPSAINKAKKLYIRSTEIIAEDVAKLPKMCDSLQMLGCYYSELETFEINSKIKDKCFIVAPFDLPHVVVGSGVLDIRFSQCDDVKMIDVSQMQTIGKLEILDNPVHGSYKHKSKSKNIFSYDNIKFPKKLSTISLDINISHFVNSFSVTDFAFIGTGDRLTSFRNIDNYSSDTTISINDDYTINSLITTLLISSPQVVVDSNLPTHNNVNDILHDYLNKQLSIRKDYIMDCAVELIDAGLDEAAEL